MFSWNQSVAQNKDSITSQPKLSDTIFYPIEAISWQNVTLESSKEFMFESPFTIENALNDIKQDSMKIVIHGGFQGFGDIDYNRSKQFETNYNVQLEYLGCIRLWDTKNEDTHGYNEKVFEHLTRKYGAKVRIEFKRIWN